jgi:hypothetical protein
MRNKIKEKMENQEEWLENLEREKPLESKAKNRWEKLYDLDKVRKETRNYVVFLKEKKITKEQEECTFQPKISESSKKITTNYSKVDFNERSDFWMKDKKERLKMMYESHKDADLQDCTFKPQISPIDFKKKKNFRDHSLLLKNEGVDKYIERQKMARKLKVENEKISKNKDKRNNSYFGKYTKTVNNSPNNIFDNLKNKSFKDCSNYLHSYLNSFDVLFYFYFYFFLIFFQIFKI